MRSRVKVWAMLWGAVSIGLGIIGVVVPMMVPEIDPAVGISVATVAGAAILWGIVGLLALRFGLSLPRWLWPSDVATKAQRRDVWVQDSIYFLATGQWERPANLFSDKLFGERLLSAMKTLRQAAFDGELSIWGRRHQYDPFKKIPASYWEYYGFNYFDVIKKENGELSSELQSNARVSMGVLGELMTSKRQVRRLRKTLLRDIAAKENHSS